MRAAALLAALLAAAPAVALDLNRDEVRGFVDEVASRHHLDRRWVARVIGAADSKPAIVEAIARPAEHVRAWYEYRAVFMTDKRVREGREFCATWGAKLDEVAARTGVPAEIVAAIVGVETSYGRQTGRWRVLDALATLAFDYPPRGAYFRAELEQFLLLSREAHFDPLTATGSYAGAMGAPQFMPRSYRAFAVDGDGDGRIDLWGDWPDIIESVAHYFVVHGWKAGEPVLAEAELWDPDVEGLPGNRLELAQTVGALRARGVLFTTPLGADAKAMLIAVRAADGPLYRVGFHNFWVITRYNRSSLYALAVEELARALAAGRAADAAAAPAADAAPADAAAAPDLPPPPTAPP